MNDSERLGHLIRRHRAIINGYEYAGDPFKETPVDEMRRILDAADLGLYWSIEAARGKQRALGEINSLDQQLAAQIKEANALRGMLEIDKLKARDLGFENVDALFASLEQQQLDEVVDSLDQPEPRDSSITDVLPAVPDSDLPF
jgi:hypothetical protein